MTPAQNPPQNGPAAAQGIPDRDPFVETDLFPLLDEPDDAARSSDRPKGFAALAQPSPGAAAAGPAAPTASPAAPAAPPAGPPAPAEATTVQPPRPLEAPPTRHTAPPLRPAMPPPGSPTPHTLWSAGPSGPPPPPVPTAVPALAAPAPRPRSQGPLIALACVTGALLLTCGALIGVLWFSGDDGSSTSLAAAPGGDAAEAPTTTAPRRLPDAPSGRGEGAAPTTTRVADPSAPTAPTTAVVTTPGAPATTAAGVAGLVADFTWTPDPATAGQSVSFADASTGGPTRWVWTWNGNVVSSSQPKGFTTTLRQNTPVTLTVCRGSGDSACASVTKMVTVG